MIAVTSCSKGSAQTPSNAGTLIVHATMTLGPVNERTGDAAVELAMAKADIRVRADDGSINLGETDAHGDARFVLVPSTYLARLVHTSQGDGMGDAELLCDAGDVPARAGVLPHRVTRVKVLCVQP